VRHYCTYFDKQYLSRGLALYHSLRAHHPSFRLYVCCFDEEVRSYLAQRALPDLIPIGSADLEAHDPAFRATRSTRTRLEYYFTSTPCWLRFLFDRFAEIELLTYVDADLRFFSSSEPVFTEMAGNSIALVEHRFPRRLRHLERCGRFNVGWLSFRRDRDGLACLDWWRERCIEWCCDRLDGNRFAEQRYLDAWPTMFSTLVVLQHAGLDVAPWNLGASRVDFDGPSIRVDGDPLICFHFHGLKHVVGPLYESGLRHYGVKLDAVARRRLFEPYLAELIDHEAELRRAGLTAGHATSPRYADRQRWMGRARTIVDAAMLLVSGTYLLTSRPDA
jgi:hypothetical protein